MRIIRSSLLVAFLTILIPFQSSLAGKRIYTVGFAQDTMKNEWRAAQVREVERALKPYANIRFIFTDAKGSSSRQALDAEQLVSKGIDFLVTSPRDADIMTPVISEIYRSGTPVILLTRQINNDQFTSFISADDKEIAREAARHIISRLGGKGRVVMLQGIATATTAKLRAEGFKKEIAKVPGIKIVAAPVADYLRANAIREMEKIIASGIKFDAIYAHSDSMAAGARIALSKAGINPAKIHIVGIDYIPEAREAIRKGQQSASFTYPTAGKQGAKTIIDLINKKSIKKRQRIPFVKITGKNVNQVKTIFR